MCKHTEVEVSESISDSEQLQAFMILSDTIIKPCPIETTYRISFEKEAWATS